MIKILHIVSALNAGGVETLLYNHYDLMNKDEFKFDFAVTCGSDELGVYAQKFKNLGCQVYNLPSKKKIFKFHNELKKIIKKNKYDIVHVHQDEKSFQSLYCAKRCGVKVRIAHAHHCYEIKGFINKILRWLTTKYSTHNFACSYSSSEIMFKNIKDIFIMNNAINVSKFEYDGKLRELIRKNLKIKNSDIVIGTIARIAEQKNPLFLIDIIHELKKLNENVKFYFIGTGPLINDVKMKIKQLELTEKCFILGEKDDANRYYNAFDVFLLPSLEEGFGISALEAQANGLITVISNGFPKAVQVNKEGVYFLSLQDTAKEWAEKIQKIICNGIDRVENDVENSDYRIDNSIKLLENKYKEILKL